MNKISNIAVISALGLTKVVNKANNNNIRMIALDVHGQKLNTKQKRENTILTQ